MPNPVRRYTAPIIMMSQNRSAQLDRVRDSSLHEKVDHMRLSQLLQLWETMQAQADDMQTLLRRWLQIQRVLRRGRGGTVNAQEWARVQMLQQASAFNTATHASGLATDSASAVPLQVAGGGCGALVSSQPCCPTCAAPWRSAASPPPWTTTTTTTTMTDGSADSASLFAARHTSNIAHISGGNASGGAGGNDEEHLDTQLDALQSSIEGTSVAHALITLALAQYGICIF